jgi:hypothetical protein
MDALPTNAKRKPISPITLIKVYEEMEERMPDSRHRADRMALLMCRTIEEVLDAARTCGAVIDEDNPAFPTNMTIAIVCELFGLDMNRSITLRIPSVDEYRYTNFIDDSGDHPEYHKGPFEARDIAGPLGLDGIWGIHKVTTAAWNIGIYGDTYTGQQAIAITKELECD